MLCAAVTVAALAGKKSMRFCVRMLKDALEAMTIGSHSSVSVWCYWEGLGKLVSSAYVDGESIKRLI